MAAGFLKQHLSPESSLLCVVLHQLIEAYSFIHMLLYDFGSAGIRFVGIINLSGINNCGGKIQINRHSAFKQSVDAAAERDIKESAAVTEDIAYFVQSIEMIDISVIFARLYKGIDDISCTLTVIIKQ